MPIREISDEKGLLTMEFDDPVDILVVEDNDTERESIVASLQASIPDVNVASTANGEDALDFLFARNAYASRAGEDPPKLILLDLALPGADGFSILGQIRSIDRQDALTLAPVVVFSNSQAAVHIRESYRCGANSYIMKPLTFSNFNAVVDAVCKYWMLHNEASQ